MAFFDFFGKKAIEDTVSGIGTWIDERDLTAEEQLKYKMELFDHMAPFKTIQRIMVTIIMRHWMVWGFNCLIAIWVCYFTGDAEYKLVYMFIDYAKLEIVWIPTASAVSLYLSGGLPIFKGNK